MQFGVNTSLVQLQPPVTQLYPATARFQVQVQ